MIQQRKDIPLKILFPKIHITLVDSLNKRINFLNEVIKELDLKNIEAVHSRIEDYAKENREKYHYSLEDLSTAINHKKNRQTLHKYENGTLNIPYDILFEICNIFKVDTKIFEEATTTEEEQSKINQKIVKNYTKKINEAKKY